VDTNADSVTDRAIKAVLDELAKRLEAVRSTNIGWPAASDVDFSALSRFFDRHLLNNLGDPFATGAYPQHTKALEAEVVNVVADLMRVPADDRWGYVTAGAGEGNLYALHLARSLHSKGVVYYSEAAHYSVDKAIDLLSMPSIRLRADEAGQMDLEDLASVVSANRDRPAIVVANVGTTMTEAVDDVREINEVLDTYAVRRRFVHADAALSGIPLALLDPKDRPGFDFVDGADSMIVSGHKFLGTPIPCGVVLVKASHRVHLTRTGGFIGSPDTTIGCSRSGHAALMIWYVIRRYGIEGLRARADKAREVARYTHRRLVEMGWEAWHNAHAFTVVLATPPPAVTERWTLATTNGRSHIICMPGVSKAQVDAFLADLRAATNTPALVSVPSPRRTPDLRRATPANVA
jgi:histidine decarboxylase